MAAAGVVMSDELRVFELRVRGEVLMSDAARRAKAKFRVTKFVSGYAFFS